MSNNSLTVYYDVLYAPVTFDFIPFMANAHLVKDMLGAQSIDLNIVAGTFRHKTPREKAYDTEQKVWRFNHIIKESVDLMPRVTSSKYSFENLSELKIPYFPSNYPPRANEKDKFILPYQPSFALSLPTHRQYANSMRFLKAPKFAHTLINAAVPESSKNISITLRTSSFQATRNSDLGSWKSLHDYLHSNGYNVFIIPDFEDTFGARRAWEFEWNILENVSINHSLRLSLYERCSLNLAVNNGTTALLAYSSNPLLVFKILTSGSGTASPEFLKRSSGLSIGEKPFHFLPTQNYVWADDTSETLISEVEKWLHIHS
jgi:hypothetical protein